MIIQFARWGNSLAVRIPAGLAKELGAIEGLGAEISISDGRLILVPAKNKKVYSLDSLLAGITSENLHPETSTGCEIKGEIIE